MSKHEPQNDADLSATDCRVLPGCAATKIPPNHTLLAFEEFRIRINGMFRILMGIGLGLALEFGIHAASISASPGIALIPERQQAERASQILDSYLGPRPTDPPKKL